MYQAFLELCQKRRSVHHYQINKNITQDLWHKLFEPVLLSPSGYNAQPWEFLVIEKQTKLLDIQKIAFGQKHVADASAVIVVLGDMNIGRYIKDIMQDWQDKGYCNPEQMQSYIASASKDRPIEQKRIMALRSTCLASMTLMYSATSLGLATCPMMGFDQHALSKYLQLPEDIFPVLMMTIGYEEENLTLPRLNRKSFEAIVSFEDYQVR